MDAEGPAARHSVSVGGGSDVLRRFLGWWIGIGVDEDEDDWVVDVKLMQYLGWRVLALKTRRHGRLTKHFVC